MCGLRCMILRHSGDHMSIPIRYLTLEGVDCCGKTSLYSSLHKLTNFKYNIHDRSSLSMVCYARLYGRDPSEHRRLLLEEVCDANNFLVVLALPFDVLLKRYKERGDDFQNETTLRNLHNIFNEELIALSRLPNVLVVREEMPLVTLSTYVASVVTLYETMKPEVLGTASKTWARMASNEARLRATLEVPIDHSDASIMNDPREGEYYLNILKSCENTIQNEISGKNPYDKPQGLDSRRFYYSSDTCISSIHFMPRDGVLRVLCTLRSTDAERNAAIDLKFLTHLSAAIPKTFDWPVDKILLDVQFNSLHIREDIV